MADRDAIDTITGYFYQFDKTILEILNQSNDDSVVVVEGDEDIDVQNGSDVTAIQCKYYAKTEYSHSVIKESIAKMVEHFAENHPSKKVTRYHLYGYFKSGQHKLGEINLDKLKNKFLTSKNSSGKKSKTEVRVYDELGLDDSTLQIFLDRLSLDIKAASYKEQYSDIIKRIKTTLNTSSGEAEYYHYNSALKVIKELSMEQDGKKRSITKRVFIDKIRARDEVFDSWYIRRRGRDAYIKSVKKQRLSSALNMDPFNRFFLIDCSGYTDLNDIKELVYSIEKKWTKISNRRSPCFCPAIYLHKIIDSDFKTIKNKMYSEGHVFVDGYPFIGAELNIERFHTMPSIENKIKFRIINSISDLSSVLAGVTGTIEIYEFYNQERFFKFSECKCEFIKIEDINYVKEMMI